MSGFSHGVIDSVLIALGWSGILCEFVRPGAVLPGAAGGVFLLVGLSRMLPEHPELAILVSVPFLWIASWLLIVAWKARRNKRSL